MNAIAWQHLAFEEAVCDVSGGNRKVQKGDYLNAGAYPVVDQGQEPIGGYCDEKECVVSGSGPWVVFGDHTRAVKYLDRPFCMGADGVKVLTPRDPRRLDAKFLYWFLVANEVPSAGYSRHFKFLKRLHVPIPPLDEQRRIAAILDEADALRQKRKRAIALLDSLTQSIFLEIFGLVGAPVSIRPKPAEGRVGRWALLTDVARLATGHTPDRKRPDYWGGSIPWLSLGDIRDMHGRVALTTKECVTQQGIDNSSSVLLPQGTVCFSRTASVGFSTMMGTPMATSQDFVNWVCGNEVLPEYLLGALGASRRELVTLATGSTHRTIYFPTVERFQLFVPPIRDQEAYVERRRSFTNVSDCFETSTGPLNELFAALQHRAFSGQL